jgi:hypothetical protein
MTEATEVRYTTQFCREGYEIGGGLYDAEDADLVRYWENDFCLVELTKTDAGAWVPTGGDTPGWTGLADLYAFPIDALHDLLPAGEYRLIDGDE